MTARIPSDTPEPGPERKGPWSNLPDRAIWPLRLLIGSALALGVGLAVLDPGLRPWLFGAFLFALALFAYTLWDETRGRAARLHELERLWISAGATRREALPRTARPTGLEKGDLHLDEAGQPLIVRLSLRGERPTVAVLTPLSESTTAFSIGSRQLPPPTFDGYEPAARGPAIEPLPGVGSLLGDSLDVRGNDPVRLTRLLDEELVAALTHAASHHADTFRGLTFDGRFLAVHWLGEEPASDPALTLARSAPLWRPFVPRLPPIAPPSPPTGGLSGGGGLIPPHLLN